MGKSQSTQREPTHTCGEHARSVDLNPGPRYDDSVLTTTPLFSHVPLCERVCFAFCPSLLLLDWQNVWNHFHIKKKILYWLSDPSQTVLHGGSNYYFFFLHSEFYHLDSNWQSPLWFTDGCRYSISYIWRRFEPEMSNSDSSFHKTCCRLSLFPLFPFLSSSFFTSTLSLRPFLLRLNQTANAEGQDAPFTSCVRTVLDLLLFLKYMTFRYCSSAVGSFLLGLPLFFVIHLCSFLILRNYMEICLCESKI